MHEVSKAICFFFKIILRVFSSFKKAIAVFERHFCDLRPFFAFIRSFWRGKLARSYCHFYNSMRFDDSFSGFGTVSLIQSHFRAIFVFIFLIYLFILFFFSFFCIFVLMLCCFWDSDYYVV